jgi:hypothetical protein
MIQNFLNIYNISPFYNLFFSFFFFLPFSFLFSSSLISSLFFSNGCIVRWPPVAQDRLGRHHPAVEVETRHRSAAAVVLRRGGQGGGSWRGARGTQGRVRARRRLAAQERWCRSSTARERRRSVAGGWGGARWRGLPPLCVNVPRSSSRRSV